MKTKRLLSWLIIATMIFSFGMITASAEAKVSEVDITRDKITLQFDADIVDKGTVTLKTVDGKNVDTTEVFDGDVLTVTPSSKLDISKKYYILSLVDVDGLTKDYKITFKEYWSDDFEDYGDEKQLSDNYTQSSRLNDYDDYSELTSANHSIATNNGSNVLKMNKGSDVFSRKIEIDADEDFDIITEMDVSVKDPNTYYMIVYLSSEVDDDTNWLRFEDWMSQYVSGSMAYTSVNYSYAGNTPGAAVSCGLTSSSKITNYNLEYRTSWTAENKNAVFSAKIDGKQILSLSGEVDYTSGIYPLGILNYASSNPIYIDNIFIYSANYEELPDVETPTLTGKFEADGTVVCTKYDENITNFYNVSYNWYRGAEYFGDEWTPVGEDSSDYPITNDDLGNYLYCKVELTQKTDTDFKISFATSPVAESKPPVAHNCELKYNDLGTALVMYYEYVDPNSDKQKSEEFIWEYSLTGLEDSWNLMDENTNTYEIKDTDINKHIRCTLTIVNEIDEKTTVTKTLKMPFAPKEKDGVVTISGTNEVGKTLTAKYDYFDENGDEEGASERNWYRVDEDGKKELVGSGAAYGVRSKDAGYSIVFGYKPISTVYPEEGDEVFSEPVEIPEDDDDDRRGNSYSNRGNSVTVTVPAKKEETVKVPEQNITTVDIGNVFVDMKNHWSKDYVGFLYEKGLVNGRENGYCPDDQLTRAEWVIMMIRSIGKGGQGSYTNCFADINSNDWYANDIQTAFSLGIINGSNNGFMPNNDITREQVVKIAIDTYEFVKGEITVREDLGKFTDGNSVSEWAVSQMEKAVKLGIINGMSDNSLSPKGYATRAEAATILYRVYNLILSN